MFDLGETLLFVVTDRISAFDVILPDPIPYKGAVLNQISAFWFKRFDDIRNHFVTATFENFRRNCSRFVSSSPDAPCVKTKRLRECVRYS